MKLKKDNIFILNIHDDSHYAFEIRYSELKCFQVAYFNLCAISLTLSFSEGFPREKRKRRDENHPTLSLVTFFCERK